MRTDKHAIAPFGIDEGKAGARGACLVNPGSAEEQSLPSRFGDHRLRGGDLVRVVRPGGGGLGNPYERPVARVLEDVRQGYVSAGRAESDYGVALEHDGGELVVAAEKTRHLRGNKQKNVGIE